MSLVKTANRPQFIFTNYVVRGDYTTNNAWRLRDVMMDGYEKEDEAKDRSTV